jgi:hypothetical protein
MHVIKLNFSPFLVMPSIVLGAFCLARSMSGKSYVDKRGVGLNHGLDLLSRVDIGEKRTQVEAANSSASSLSAFSKNTISESS